MLVYFVKTDSYNNLVFTEGLEAIIRDCAPSGMFEGIDLYAEDAASRLKAHFEALNEAGELNDFSDIWGDREKINHDLYELLAGSEVIFSDGAGIEIWSVELALDFADDTFCGTLEECHEYCQEYDYTIGENCRIAKISVDDHFCAIDTLEIITEA